MNFEKPKTLLEEAQRIIDGFEAGVEDEFTRTANTWPECFGGHIFPLETYLDMAEKELGAEKYKEVMGKVEALTDRVLEIKKQYPDKNNPPPNKIKKDLLGLLRGILS